MLPALLLAFALGEFGQSERNHGDLVTLKQGQVLEGRVLTRYGGRTLVRVEGREVDVADDDIRTIETTADSVRELIGLLPPASDKSAAKFSDLARFARSRRLEHEERLLSWLVLARDPAHDAAHETLGHRRFGESWQVRDRNERWVEFRDYLANGAKWVDALELESLHYALRSTQPLEDAIRCLFLLERAYATWSLAWSDEVPLIEQEVPMVWHVRAEPDYRHPTHGVPGSRVRLNRHVVPSIVDASEELPRRELITSALDQAIFESFWGRKESLALPPALAIGLANALAEGPWLETGPVREPKPPTSGSAFDLHVEAEDPFSLQRVLTFDWDFLDQPRDGALARAEATTFVSYLLQAEDGQLRPRLAAFLRTVAGLAATTKDFDRCLEKSRPELEREWNAWVRAQRR